jgi:hypothetical protein
MVNERGDEDDRLMILSSMIQIVDVDATQYRVYVVGSVSN